MGWYDAVKDAADAIEKHSAVLWMRRVGRSESDIMEAVGLKTRSMCQRHAIEDESGLAARVTRAWNDTKTAQGAR